MADFLVCESALASRSSSLHIYNSVYKDTEKRVFFLKFVETSVRITSKVFFFKYKLRVVFLSMMLVQML